MKTLTIEIDNLKCGGCANTVKKKIKHLNDVATVEVAVEEGAVTIEYEGEDRKQEFVDALTKSGYPEKGTSNFVQKAKSYVSCAVGRMGSDE